MKQEEQTELIREMLKDNTIKKGSFIETIALDLLAKLTQEIYFKKHKTQWKGNGKVLKTAKSKPIHSK